MNAIQTEFIDTMTDINERRFFAGCKLQRWEGRDHKIGWYIEDDELASTHDGKGQIYAKREAFMRLHGLRFANYRIDPLWPAVLPKWVRARPYRCRGVYEDRLAPFVQAMAWPMHDHAVLFRKGSNYVYTTQPYDATPARFRQLREVFSAAGLFVNISLQDAWWYPGKTPLIVISQLPITLTKDIDTGRLLHMGSITPG